MLHYLLTAPWLICISGGERKISWAVNWSPLGKWDQKMVFRHGVPMCMVRVHWELLPEAPVHAIFNSHLWQCFHCISKDAKAIESEWTMFHTSVVDKAARSCGRKVVGVCCGCNLRIRWNESYYAGLALGLERQFTGTSRPSITQLQQWLTQKLGCGSHCRTEDQSVWKISKTLNVSPRAVAKSSSCTKKLAHKSHLCCWG